MRVQSTRLITFSPTRTTQRVVEGIARGVAADRVERLDLTPPGAATREVDRLGSELAIIGAPVYGGRIPTDAVARLRRLTADHTPAAVVVVYGNRAYEDALLELRDLATQAGFTPIAGGAFIGEHSFSTEDAPVAAGRPDAADLAKAEGFGRQIRAKLDRLRALDEVEPLEVPGNAPYKERTASAAISPRTQDPRCTKCGTCAAVCPVAAIAIGETVATDPEACIQCCACVRGCPTGAMVMDHPRIQRSVAWLRRSCSDRREPETFL